MNTAVKPMLAKDPKYSDKGQPVVPVPCLVQAKLDGIRAFIVDGVVRSRTFKPIPNLEIQERLGRPEFNGLDGEIIVGSPTAEGCMQSTSSFVMAPGKTEAADLDGLTWTFHVFDRWDRPGQSYTQRMEGMEKLVYANTRDARDAVVVQSYEANTLEELVLLEQTFVGEGHEGIIVRDPSAPYKHGRSGVKGPLLKVKRFIDFEAEVIGVYEEMENTNEAKRDAFGRTERSTMKAGKVGKDRLGGFELRAINGPAKDVEFRCGTGFDAEQREALWRYVAVPPPLQKERGLIDQTGEASGLGPLKGKIVKIKSFPIGVKDKPRFPVFLGFRDMEIDG